MAPLREPVEAFIALGGNLGAAVTCVTAAMEALGRLPGIRLVARSPLYRTAPHEASGPDFINAVVKVSTTLAAPALLEALQVLEQAAGRERPYPNAPRTLDMDLLLYGSAHIDSPRLTVPHPRMMARAFVLVPLAALAPERVSGAALEAVKGQPLTAL
jgi:2-amino-4-hydroxy-6-hydroxymethyldihydropteridine diphosphokinase